MSQETLVLDRMSEILKKLERRRDIILSGEKGEIEIHFKNKSVTVKVSVIDGEN